MGTKNNKEKGKDFFKPKIKIGKGQIKKSNQTDSSIKTKKIYVQKQKFIKSIEISKLSSEKKEEIEILDKLKLIKKKSKSNKKDVLIYLRRNIPKSASLCKEILFLILPLMLDDSKETRCEVSNLILDFSKKRLLVLRSNLKTIILFVHSMMTHIKLEIRNDSTNLFQILIDTFPNEISSFYFVKSLQQYFFLMSWNILGQEKKTFSGTGSFIPSLFNSHLAIHLSTLNSFLKTSLFENEDVENNIKNLSYSFHPLTHKYIPPSNPNPFAPLSLFSNDTFNDLFFFKNVNKSTDKINKILSDLNSLPTESVEIRKEIVKKFFLKSLKKNLSSLMLEGGKIEIEAKGCLSILNEAYSSQINDNIII